jgi:hypothetical protein
MGGFKFTSLTFNSRYDIAWSESSSMIIGAQLSPQHYCRCSILPRRDPPLRENRYGRSVSPDETKSEGLNSRIDEDWVPKMRLSGESKKEEGRTTVHIARRSWNDLGGPIQDDQQQPTTRYRAHRSSR